MAQLIQRATWRTNYGNACCENMQDAWAQDLIMIRGDTLWIIAMYRRMEIKFCPFCGKPIETEKIDS